MTARRGLVPALTLTMLVAAVGASAFWTMAGSGIASATTATLSAATIATPASATNSITVTFSQQASLAPGSAATSAIAYIVQRKLAGGSFAAIAGGGCSGSKPYAIASCADVPPATGSYTYRAVATFHSWTATSSESGPVAFLLDTTVPTAQSIQRLDASPTNGATVRWTVTFSEAVTGVGSGDFALTGSLTGGAITAVTGSATTYTVTSSTGTGDGTLRLDLVDDDSITDVAGNALGGAGSANGNVSGQSYAVDRTAPALSTLSLRDTNANGRVDTVTATFGEPLASSTATAPWTLAGVPSGGTLSAVSTSGAVATLTLTEGAGAIDTTVAAMTVALAASATGIRDATGNQSAFAATAPADKAGPVPVVVADDDTGTGVLNFTNGKLAKDDTLLATFSEAILPATVTTPTTISEGSTLLTNTFLTIGGFTNGALNMGSPTYTLLAVTVTFNATAALSDLNRTLTITVGTCASGCVLGNLLQGSGAMDYVPAPALTDAAGNAATGSFHTTFPLF